MSSPITSTESTQPSADHIVAGRGLAGFCRCGCGRLTNPAKQTDRAKGYVKGQRMPYLQGHVAKDLSRYPGRSMSSGYMNVIAPDLPKYANGRHRRRGEHVLIAERALGKPLPAGAEVHHFDGNRANNANSNLVVCQDLAYHKLLHRRQRAFAACGHAHWQFCSICQTWDAPENLYLFPREGRSGGHPACRTARSARQWRREHPQ